MAYNDYGLLTFLLAISTRVKHLSQNPVILLLLPNGCQIVLEKLTQCQNHLKLLSRPALEMSSPEVGDRFELLVIWFKQYINARCGSGVRN